ncbi:MAG: AMP-binding protein [Bacteroidales bacterium]|jgi:long-chain acyl-CoA synthetase|nr:AMP-binding protein [Bacteroidales bacterium]
MESKNVLTIPFLASESFRKNGENKAMGFVGEEVMTYNQLKSTVDAIIAMLEKYSVGHGDRVAILSGSMPNWGATYLAVTSMGAVVVPILPDFTPEEISNVLIHSGSMVLFVSGSLTAKVAGFRSEALRAVFTLDDFAALSGYNGTGFAPALRPEKEYQVVEEDLAAIIYTSGTTGKSKGVMLTHKNISFTAQKCLTLQKIENDDVFLSILPLSHTYEQTLGLILPLFNGAAIYYLRKAATPAVLLPALELVRPTVMLTVPLIMEKIYFNKIAATFNKKKIISLLYRTAPFRRLLNRLAGKKLYQTFGGRLKFFGIGGAKLNHTVEQFLIDAKFPYAIGYGLTETSPLLAGTMVGSPRLGSTGRAMEGVTLKIENPDPVTSEGEVWARGENVMRGYFNEPEKTAEVITPDGWFRTGDLGIISSDGFLSIKGRLKNMIVGSSGENIYPEEIESVINDFGHVIESLVVQQKGKLVAMVHLNIEELQVKYHHMKKELSEQAELKVDEYLEEIRKYVNSRVNKFSQLQVVVYQPEPFQKTATLKIKRFLYY